MKKSKIVLVRCEDYSRENVQKAVNQGLLFLGGVAQFVSSGESILFKPNLLTAKDKNSITSPHAEVMRAVILAFQAVEGNYAYGDSPGHGKGSGIARKLGYFEALAGLNVACVDFVEAETVSFLEGNLIKKFEISKEVLAVDGLVSVSKMKSHALTRMTGAIKNQFGCIPGIRKAEFHGRLPNVSQFSEMLIDLNLLLKPRLFIMDGVIAMEGNGPGNGTPKQMNVLLFSTDAAALDATVCRMVDLDLRLMETLTFAKKYGLGQIDEAVIEILGDDLSSFVCEDFDVNRKVVETAISLESKPLQYLMRNFVTPKPVIIADMCKNCGRCVEICPAEPKAVDYHDGDRKKIPTYHYSDCIRCYCCQEMCPHDAIEVVTPLLGQLVRL